jgi:hypothetical protein
MTVDASFLYDIGVLQLGTYGGMGVQPGIGLPGGGQLTATGVNPNPTRSTTVTLSGGDQESATGTRQATTTLTLSGGGNLGTDSPRPVVLFLSGGGAPALVAGPEAGFHLPLVQLFIEAPALALGAPPAPTPAGLILTVVDTTLDISPGSLTVFVANGTPDEECAFTVVDGAISTPAISTTFDDAGAVAGLSVPIDVVAEGTYSLVVTDMTTALTASADFSVAAVATTQTIGVPVTTPPPSVQPGTGVRKWVFQDPVTGETYHFPINPNKMNSPFPPKKITFLATTSINGAKLAFEGQSAPVDWQFSGTLFTKAQYDAFVAWTGKRNRIWITDHYGRAWLCYLTHFDPQARRDVVHPWCHEWSMSALIFEGPVTPV